jgi:SulP family sulfate permease
VACGINSIDVAGAEMLVHESERRRKLNGALYLCGLKQQAREVLERGGYIDIIGKDHIFESEAEAILDIMSRLDSADCHRCLHPLFKECENVRLT